MMPFVGCPSCGIKLDVPESLLGNKVRCATCSNVFEAIADTSPGADDPAARQFTSNAPPARDESVRQIQRGNSDRRWEDEDDYREGDEPWYRGHMRRDLVPHRGGLILGLGIGSVVAAPLAMCLYGVPSIIAITLGIFAWVMGRGDLRRIDGGEMDPDGRGMTQGGYICGIIGTVLGALSLVVCGLLMVVWIGMLSTMK